MINNHFAHCPLFCVARGKELMLTKPLARNAARGTLFCENRKRNVCDCVERYGIILQ